MDELTDISGQAVFCVVAGVLDKDRYHNPYVVYVQEMHNGNN